MTNSYKGNAAWVHAYFQRHPDASVDTCAREAFRVHKGLRKGEISRIRHEVLAQRDWRQALATVSVTAKKAQEAVVAPTVAAPTVAAPTVAAPKEAPAPAAPSESTAAVAPAPAGVKLPAFSAEALAIGRHKTSHAGGETRKAWLAALVNANPTLTAAQCGAFLIETFGISINRWQLVRIIRVQKGGPYTARTNKPPKRHASMPPRYRKVKLPAGLVLPNFPETELTVGRGGRAQPAVAVRRKWLDALLDVFPTLSLDQCQRALYETFGSGLSNNRILEVLKLAREIAEASKPAAPPVAAVAKLPPAPKAPRPGTLEDELRHLLRGLREMAERNGLAHAALVWNGATVKADYRRTVSGALEG